MPWIVSITGTDCGYYQNYIGLQEKKADIRLTGIGLKKVKPSSLEKKSTFK